MRVVFFLRGVNYGRHFENLLRGLLTEGHEVRVLLDRARKGRKGDERLFAQLRAEHAALLSWDALPPPSDRRRAAAAARLRFAIDYLRFAEARYAEADVLRTRARDRAPASVVAVAERAPWSRPALDAALRRLERSLPPDPAGVDEPRRAVPAVV